MRLDICAQLPQVEGVAPILGVGMPPANQIGMAEANQEITAPAVAGAVAHDINNLLTAVMIYSGLLRASLSENPALLGFVLEIEAAATQASALLMQLLRPSPGEVLPPQRRSIGESLEAMRDFLHHVLGDHVQLLIERFTLDDEVRIDTTQLHEIVLNLTLNARDAMPAGGRLVIEITAAGLEGDEPPLSVAPGQYVVVKFRDSGHGMTPEVQSRIFEPFFTTKAKGKGTGLGMPIVREIVQQCGGGIMVNSLPDAGTTVAVYLPFTADVPPSKESVLQRGTSAKSRVASPLPKKAEPLLRRRN